MSLFAGVEEKEEENITLFGEEGEEKNGGRVGESDGGNNGGADRGNDRNTGNNHDRGHGDSDGGNNGESDGGTGAGIGLFSLSVASSSSTGNNEDTGSSNNGLENGSGNVSGTSNESEPKSPTKKQPDKRPSFLGFGEAKEVEKKEDDSPKDIKIKKGSSAKKKKTDNMSEEQVEILFSSLFDGIALFKGQHWKLQEDEKHIIPSLTRIVNRMLEMLPKGISQSAFNIADYVIVLGAIAGMILTRMKMDKEVKKNGTTGTIENGARESVRIQTGNEASRNTINDTVIPNGEPNKRNEDGYSTTSPIKDLASSIVRIS